MDLESTSPTVRSDPWSDEETLDPADWETFRRVGHELLDEIVDWLADVRERPVWRSVPEETRRWCEAPPREPSDLAEVIDEVRRRILPYPTGNIHPRFWGWVHGSGTPTGVLAEMIAAAMNSNVGGRDHAAVHVEREVLGWFRSIFGFPESFGGILVSGTSMATLIALTVAREKATGFRARQEGLEVLEAPLRVYASRESHGSVRRALEVLGLGGAALRGISADGDGRIDPVDLVRAIERDRADGARPLCVVGCAGTVRTGAIDDLDALADVCADEDVWLHVDGAFGAMVALSDTLRDRVRGIERADSLAFDFHKWLHVPYDAGCVLVRDGEAHRRTFRLGHDYLERGSRGLFGGTPWFCDYGPELSRGFRALKVWMTVRHHGLDRLATMIEKNCGQAAMLGRWVADRPELELMAPVHLNIVCFRRLVPGADGATVDRVNREIVERLHEHGIAAPSITRVDGALAIRVCLTNHRTRASDLDELVRAVVGIPWPEFAEETIA